MDVEEQQVSTTSKTVKFGIPTDDEIEQLGSDIASAWMTLGRRLGVGNAKLQEITEQAPYKLPEKGYHMLKCWKESKGSDATYEALCHALQHDLVRRQDLAEKFCYSNEKEVAERNELRRVRLHSAKMKEIVRQTTSLEERLRTLEEQVKSLLVSTIEKDCNKTMVERAQEILEITLKQLNKLIENMVKVELGEMELLTKEIDQINNREETPEEREKFIEKSSDCNYNVVLKGTASCEKELAVDRTPNALESDNSPVSVDRQENMRFLDRASPPLKLTQPKSEGNQTSSWCYKLEEDLGAPKTEREQLIKLKHNEEKTLVADEPNREKNVKETSWRLVPEESELEQITEKFKGKGEKRNIESQFPGKRTAVQKKIQENRELLMKFEGENERLTKENNDHLEKIKDLENQNKVLVTENKDLQWKIKSKDCDTRECNRLKAELNRLSTENNSLKKKNERSPQTVGDLKKKIKTLETSECGKLKTQITVLSNEKEGLTKAKEESLQRIEGLEKQLREERDSIATANADYLQKIEDLKKKLKEANKCKNAVSRALLPRGEDFQSPGAIYTLRNVEHATVVASRSSDGPGKADDVLNRRLGKEIDCGTNDSSGSQWWCVDLGENYLLFPTHYSLRHGKKGHDSILRNWKLQGSTDGKDWKDIATHRRKGEFTQPFRCPTDTWSVEGKVEAFRYFKIIQTGKNSSDGLGLYLSGMEFYGVLLKA